MGVLVGPQWMVSPGSNRRVCWADLMSIVDLQVTSVRVINWKVLRNQHLYRTSTW